MHNINHCNAYIFAYFKQIFFLPGQQRIFSVVVLAAGGRVANGCGDDIIRLGANVVNGRFVTVDDASVVYIGIFVVVDLDNGTENREVVEMPETDGSFVVIFGI